LISLGMARRRVDDALMASEVGPHKPCGSAVGCEQRMVLGSPSRLLSFFSDRFGGAHGCSRKLKAASKLF
jgi:hypothetical protein